MSDPHEIANFLRQMKDKVGVFDIVFLDRPKNFQTLVELEITPAERRDTIMDLETRDYYRGPLSEDWHGAHEMWVFGKEVKGKEIYIKICLGAPNSRVVCISFHIAEYPLTYPFQ